MTRVMQAASVYEAGAFKKSHIYEALQDSDVLLPAILAFGARAVGGGKSKKEPHIKLTLEIALPVNISPSNTDVGWTLLNAEELTDVLVVLAYKKGTLNFDGVESLEEDVEEVGPEDGK